ncbi:MAG: hypothetical protein ABSG43_08245 [Solirubrobacteraceae bacterium]|jgi:hypothetical protein
MLNPVTATLEPAARDVQNPAPPTRPGITGGPFAPLFTHAVEVALSAVRDELVRLLARVFVPDGELL